MKDAKKSDRISYKIKKNVNLHYHNLKIIKWKM